MRHLIFSIVGSPPESPSVNPPGAGTIGFETEYQVGHNAPPDILIGIPASLLLLACSPRPGVARQHERFPENDSPWLHLKSEHAERPIQRLRPVAYERRQRERHGPRPGCGITERPSPTLVVAVHEIIPSISFASPTAVRNINWNIMFQLIFPVVSLLLRPGCVTCVSRTRMREGHMAQSDRARSSCR